MSLRPQSLSEARIVSELHQGIGEWLNRSGWHEKAGRVVDADLPRSIDVVAYDRPPRNQRLRQGAGQPLTEAGVNQRIHRPQILGNLAGVDEAGEVKVPRQS